MKKQIDKDTRYYLDLDLAHRTIINLDYDNRHGLAQILENPSHHRVFLTKGQFTKLETKITGLKQVIEKI